MTTSDRNPSARLEAIGQDERTGEWFNVFRVRDPLGRKRLVAVPFTANDTMLFAALAKAGWRGMLSRVTRAKLLAQWEGEEPKRHVQIVSTPGWAKPGVFVTPWQTYPPHADLVVNFGGHMANQRFAVSGTLEQWQTEVAAPLRKNSTAMFGVMSAFAGPPMRILKIESGGFDLVGESSIGKSSVIAASGSVWGGGGPLGFAQSYLATRNALDVIAAAHSDCFLALDETNLGGENRREAAATILHAAYRFSAGEEKARQTDQAARLTWRLTFLGSSEHSLDQLARYVDEPVSLGQRVRIIDIAADAGRGMGVWEELHGAATTPARFSDLVRERAHEIYGCPADAYLTQLTEWAGRDEDGLASWLEARMEFCLRALGVDRANGARARIARRFALVYAAGCLAAKFGILPWTREEMLQAVKACHSRVILPPDALTAHTPERSIAVVRDYIERNERGFIDTGLQPSLTKEDLQSAGGAIHRGQDGKLEFLFTNAQFRGEICDGLPVGQVYGDLKAADLLHCQKGGKWGVTRDLPEPLGRVRMISVKEAILG